MKKKIISIAIIAMLLLAGMFALTGCGLWENTQSSVGIFKSKGDYIVINYSGGEIFDVWKLKDAYVSNSANSDGYEFTDSAGNFITVSGDVLVIRCNSGTTWDDYKEYHKNNVSEQESKQ